MTSWKSGRRLALGLAVAGVLAGCYPKGAPPPGALPAEAVAKASARWPGVTESSLSKGRDLFLAKCNGCHAYPDLAAVTEARWPDVARGMAKKSDMTPEQAEAMLQWILTARSEKP